MNDLFRQLEAARETLADLRKIDEQVREAVVDLSLGKNTLAIERLRSLVFDMGAYIGGAMMTADELELEIAAIEQQMERTALEQHLAAFPEFNITFIATAPAKAA
jgi:hypothetical protein